MKKVKFISIICLFILFVDGTIVTAKEKKAAAKTETVKAEKKNDVSSVTKTTITRTIPEWVLYTIPGTFVICLIVLLYLLFHLRSKVEKLTKEIEKLTSNVTTSNSNQLTKNQIQSILEKEIKKSMSGLENRIGQLEVNEKEKKEETKQQTIIKQSIPSVLYASPVDPRTSEFYDVTSIPNDKTIFELQPSNSREATFKVYEKAHSKVLQCADFLDGSCDIENSGSAKIISGYGSATKQNNGKWIVTTKAKVKFE